MLAFKTERKSAKYVIWPRIDQQSCLKSILLAGFEPIIIDGKIEGDEIRTDLEAVQTAIKRVGAENVVCVMTTASCFAPRSPDLLVEVAKICAKEQVPHLVNNAYGLQCAQTTQILSKAGQAGRVDAFVQSMDKNFMVPVGGSIVASFDEKVATMIGKSYPGGFAVSLVWGFLVRHFDV